MALQLGGMCVGTALLRYKCVCYLSFGHGILLIGDAGGTWESVFKIQVASVAFLLGSAWQVTRARPPSHRLTFPGMSVHRHKVNRWRKIP